MNQNWFQILETVNVEHVIRAEGASHRLIKAAGFNISLNPCNCKKHHVKCYTTTPTAIQNDVQALLHYINIAKDL
ncbi:hypothetical protein V5O48_010211 [Marasmius crinis-equi]|uniref:Uncharacterized protein n=1 Tax=Marasmius crinis-equi TaxID=585013 RepID=A0ABR3F900_9AGAR